MALEKWLLVPDTHVPYHDKKAVSLMLRAAKQIGIENVAILGDFLDCFSISSYPKPPSRKLLLNDELEAGNDALDEFDSVFKKKKKYVEGNHEFRLESYLTQRAPELYGTISIPERLRLKERGWDFTPYKQHTKIGKLYLTHDAGKTGKLAHVDALNSFQGNVVIGHTHRLAYSVEGNARGKPHVGAMFGWLGDVNKVDYLHRIRALRDWALGFGILYKEPDGCVHVTPVPIVNGRVVVEGRLIK